MPDIKDVMSEIGKMDITDADAMNAIDPDTMGFDGKEGV